MKKLIAFMLCAAVLLLCCCGCSKKDKDGKLKIVATTFPLYDWIMQVIGSNPGEADVTLLLDKGVDLHSYQPSVDDIIKISDCDVFIYVGGESDQWVSDALKQAKNKDMIVINLMDTLKDHLKDEELVEGMQGASEEEEEDAYDEHIWLSLHNASLSCDAIRDALCRADEKNADIYRKNTVAYQKKLTSLDQDFRTAVSGGATDTIVVGDRFPFRYLCDDYRIRYFAAFSGCSAETQASFATIIFLAKKVDEYGLKTILKTESADDSVASTIKDNTTSKDQQLLTLDSMQSVTSEQIKGGTTYLSVMQSNLAVLQQALSAGKHS